MSKLGTATGFPWGQPPLDLSRSSAATHIGRPRVSQSLGAPIPCALDPQAAVLGPRGSGQVDVEGGLSPRKSGSCPQFSLASFSGRLIEISASAAGAPLTLAFRLVLDAQRRGEPAAWIARRDSTFFPPDAAEAGVDLGALPVVRAPEPIAAARAADLLVRSGAFGLVVLDLGGRSRLPMPAFTRLGGLAHRHGATVVFLTEKDPSRPSLGPLVALRAHAARVAREQDRFFCEARVLKDKRGRPGWRHAEVFHGPDGLR